MNKRRLLFVGAALAAVPAFAMQQNAQKSRPAPTQPGELILFEALDHGGDSYVIDQSRTNVRTSWNIRSVGIHPGARGRRQLISPRPS